MTNILIYLIAGFLGSSVVLSAFDMYKERKAKKEIEGAVKEYVKLMIDKDAAHMAYFKSSFEGLTKITKDIGSFLLSEGQDDPFGSKVPMNPALRVYALLFRKFSSFEQKVYCVPGHTLEEAKQMAYTHLGVDWELVDSSFMDVSVPRITPLPTKFEEPVKKEKGAMEYVNYLEYALENFTEKKVEKEVLAEIINRVKIKHGNSTNKKS